ncbi:hypothetical protein RRF57_012144 [Xylaria bambusicola]|uniref:Uncharacterized protein n=1 Tax=Xylaria bambusicola TaxID=326684 RepID=A0AAN7UUR5_9PEZI
MSAPRTKRQFAGAASDPAQRQITSFFHTATSAPPNSNSINQISSPATQGPENASNIPATVQANLLSVGMRIRKSVPEGYKTGSYNAFALWDESDADPITVTMGEGQRSRANAFSSPRELLPFCGIHKVGGLDTQPEVQHPIPSIPSMRAEVPTTTVYQPSFSTEMSDDEVPGLTSSQESVGSNTSDSALSGVRTRKRFFVEDEEETPGQLNLWQYNHDICSLTPVGCNNGRVMAVPRKGRLRAKFSGTATAMPGGGQENVIDSDFEDAEFLDRGTWEVNMSDA